MLTVTWTKVGAEWPHFPFSGGPGLHVDLQYGNNPPEYFDLFITPELANLEQRKKQVYPTISRKYAKLENKI
jgi:hypothetical protein